MDYTTADRVQALCKRLPTFGETSPVRLDDVNALIEQYEAEVNLALRLRGLAVPVTEPVDLVRSVEKNVTMGVAGAVLRSVFQDSGGPNSESSKAEWQREWIRFIDYLRNPSNDLSAIASAGTGVASWGDYTDECGESTVEGRGRAPAFSRRMTW